MNNSKRLDRERKTIRVMIKIYCQTHHTVPAPVGSNALCPECQNLLDYAMQRVDKCPFKAEKPTCARCSIHCYQPGKRQQIRQVMRYAGPRMLLFHPLLALQHFWDEIKYSQGERRKA